jgi:peptidoglycan/xylan/chitin deacetylase (PgdA/CDA1 family)
VGQRERAARLMDRTKIGGLVRLMRTWEGLLVLNYHRIGEASTSPLERNVFSATPQALDHQLAFARKHFDIIEPQDVPRLVGARRGRYLLFTFDDGYRDSYEHAFRLLKAHGKAHGLPATFFLTTGFIDLPRLAWWDEMAWMVRRSTRDRLDRSPFLDAPLQLDHPDCELALRALLRAYKTLPGDDAERFLDWLAESTGAGRADTAVARDVWMTWDMAREMRAAGMSFGGHTVNHPILGGLPLSRQAEEIAGCKRRLEAELGEPMRWFSYPVGTRQAFNRDTRACLEGLNVELAFSFYGGYGRMNRWDPYDIPRATVGRSTTEQLFRATLTLPQVFARP